VNLNFTGFHKILKKHDRRLPNPCKAFYTARLHDQSWVRGDYSDVIVAMSRAYSTLRGDEEIEAKDNEKQVNFFIINIICFFVYQICILLCILFYQICIFIMYIMYILFMFMVF
jgi:SPX domain protein involved in polyphosphate accumulation